MSVRQDYPSSNPASDVARIIDAARRTGEENAAAIARGALPEPLYFRATCTAPGPPPIYLVEIVNAMTGAAIPLGTI